MHNGVEIKPSSQGSVFSRGKRVGKFGNPFKNIQLQVSGLSVDKFKGPSTANDDLNITNITRG